MFDSHGKALLKPFPQFTEWEFLKAVKVQYRMNYLSCVTRQKTEAPPFLDERMELVRQMFIESNPQEGKLPIQMETAARNLDIRFDIPAETESLETEVRSKYVTLTTWGMKIPLRYSLEVLQDEGKFRQYLNAHLQLLQAHREHHLSVIDWDEVVSV